MASFNYTTLFENAQNYNKYAYVLNNPLKYTDPSGYYPESWSEWQMGSFLYMKKRSWERFYAQTGFDAATANELSSLACLNLIDAITGGYGSPIPDEPNVPDVQDGEDGGSADGGEIDFLIGISFDFTFATPYGGYAYEIGWIQSPTGLPISRLFESTGNAFGAEISASFNVFILISTTSAFEIEDIEGLGYSWDVTYIGSITIASDGTPSYPEDKIGNSFFAFKVGIGLGAGVVSTSKTDTHLLGTFFNYLGGFNYVYF